ncbi:hypothetical protein [Terrimonas pollutisoli]|uniref:hypothetical protein n=1 Tax=Terrimonas pollutisoli TaxID=3034147 RepID=UPI0023EA9A23|nr:hypothetical protein [Terrimonas sp. H1YJ31]
MKRFYIILFIAFLFVQLKSNAQGCVAIRSNGTTCTLGKPGEAKGWQFNFNTRYFRSYKHFVGKEEQHERVENGTEVINYSLNWDLTFTKALSNRWSVAFNLPLISNVRSSMYEHYGNNNSAKQGARRKTESFGIGDIRIAAYRWLLNPVNSPNANIQAGLGIKLPTGDYKYQDYFHKLSSTEADSAVLGPVDQSIQLGDGGTGFTVELNGFYNIIHNGDFGFGVYGNFYYLINPRETNGTSTARGGAVSATNQKYFTSVMSVPDQYMARGGVNFMLDKFNLSAGIRTEAIPSSDLFGGDRGFRRPGIVTSIEPTISYTTKKGNFYVSVPVAISRNRTQSYSDKLRTIDDGVKRQGDAAFADYLINAGFSIRL